MKKTRAEMLIALLHDAISDRVTISQYKRTCRTLAEFGIVGEDKRNVLQYMEYLNSNGELLIEATRKTGTKK